MGKRAPWRAPKLGLAEKLLGVALVVYGATVLFDLGTGASAAALIVAVGLAIGVGLRYLSRGIRYLIWRLSNRLVVAYLFIAVVPILLLLILAQLGAWALAGQVGIYLLNSELDRRVASIANAAASMSRVPAGQRTEAMRRAAFIYQERYPGLEIVVHDRGTGEIRHYPENSTLGVPGEGHKDTSGLVIHRGYFHLWSHMTNGSTTAVVMVPITRNFLLSLVPKLGAVTLLPSSSDPANGAARTDVRIHPPVPGEPPLDPQAGQVPAGANRFDMFVPWGFSLPVAMYDRPGTNEVALLGMRTRISSVMRILFSLRGEWDQPTLLNVLLAVAILFLIVEAIAAFIGISLSRTITRAVNNLYEGTERVKEGDFTHRIAVSGTDQLAELGKSFNSMTENLERLVKVEKERERLHAELEIAREVQNQLHPKKVPDVGSLRMTALCTPARMVSGDYFDYQKLDDETLVIAIGDVAGKGISAALLMATVQAALRAQLRQYIDVTAAAKVSAGGGPDGNGDCAPLSTSQIVSNLNQQLYASTSPEKYATFYISVWDERTGVLTYTNAGHLPPLLIRRGVAIPLEINGMVVGAFPFARYQESQIPLESGDLLVCYTDGITEPENAYGEMFGEERLIDLLIKNAHLHEQELMNTIVQAVQQWTSSPELHDDMTLLLARKL